MHKLILDDFYYSEEESEFKYYWTQMCQKCLKKHKDFLKKASIDNNGHGICGVKGCNNGNEDDEIETVYVDFGADYDAEILIDKHTHLSITQKKK